MLYINNFLKYSIFIGHSVLNSLVLSSWFFYKLKKKIWIINIFKTIIFLKMVLKFLKFLVTNNLPFWFINIEHDKEYIFKKAAFESGEFSCTQIWVRGLLSNFKSIQYSVSQYLLKKNIIISNEKQNLMKNWIFTRFTWPRGIFLANVPLNYIVCKEAATSLLPVVAMIDTNIKSYLFNFPIPSNDDSLESISYIINILSKNLLLLKYKKVILWYRKFKLKNIKTLNILKNIGLKKVLFKKKRHKKYFKMVKVRNFNFYSKFLFKIKWSNLLFSNLFDSFFLFKKNIQSIKKIPSFNNKKSIILESPLLLEGLYRKLKFIKVLSNRKNFYNKFLKRHHYKILSKPKALLSKTIKLKYIKFFRRKRKASKRKFLLNYFMITNLIKKVRPFYETFIINKPSDFTFVRRCHIPKLYNSKATNDYWAKKDLLDYGEWHYAYGFKYKINDVFKEKWLNNKFNSRLKNEKWQKIAKFSDSAVLLNLARWRSTIQRKIALQKFRKKEVIFKFLIISFYCKIFYKRWL